MDLSDADWRTVNLPHDWAVELPFDPRADVNHGFKPVGPGFATNDIAWYRRTFELAAADSDKRIWLEFDGVFRNCDVFVNGWFVGHHDSGYEGLLRIVFSSTASSKTIVPKALRRSKWKLVC
jgi:beta-galactosidase